MRYFFITLYILFLNSCQTIPASNTKANLEKYARHHNKSLKIQTQKFPESYLQFKKSIHHTNTLALYNQYFALHDHVVFEDKKEIILKDISNLKKQWQKDLKTAQAISSKTGKELLIKFEADWCSPCKLQTVDLYKNENSTLYDDYVLLKIDVTENFDLLKKMTGSGSLPNIVVYKPRDFKKIAYNVASYNKNMAIAKQIKKARVGKSSIKLELDKTNSIYQNKKKKSQ